MSAEDSTEELVTKCAECGEPVTSYWVRGGGCISRPEYLLVADWIFHTDCWNKKVDDYEFKPLDEGAGADEF